MRALRSTSLVRRVTPCGCRMRRRGRRFQSEKVENGLRHRRASARVRRIERLRRSRNLARHLKPSYRVKKTRFDTGIARAQHARNVRLRFRVFIGREDKYFWQVRNSRLSWENQCNTPYQSTREQNQHQISLIQRTYYNQTGSTGIRRSSMENSHGKGTATT